MSLLFFLTLWSMVIAGLGCALGQFLAGSTLSPGDPLPAGSSWQVCPNCHQRSQWSMGGLGIQRDLCVSCGHLARASIDCKARGCHERVDASVYLRQHGWCAWHLELSRLRERDRDRAASRG